MTDDTWHGTQSLWHTTHNTIKLFVLVLLLHTLKDSMSPICRLNFLPLDCALASYSKTGFSSWSLYSLISSKFYFNIFWICLFLCKTISLFIYIQLFVYEISPPVWIFFPQQLYGCFLPPGFYFFFKFNFPSNLISSLFHWKFFFLLVNFSYYFQHFLLFCMFFLFLSSVLLLFWKIYPLVP